jgi:Uncharacterized protein conserved in bacteria (DUF2252)
MARLSMADRVQSGRAARGETPRSSHATFEAPPTRADPIELLERQAKTRVPELVPIRYGRMLASPFAFFRGAAMIMAHDLAATPRTGLTVQCCGDAHLSNFGVFASPERRLVFDLNDFDETLPGPWEWDVKRLATSMRIAAIENDFSAVEQERIVLGTVQAYRTLFRRFAQMTDLDVWYAHIDTEEAVTRFGSELTSDAVRWTEDGLARGRARPRRRRREPARAAPRLQRDARVRSPGPGGALRARRPGPQGGGRRQRGHPHLDRPDAGTRWPRAAVPADQGGGEVCPRALLAPSEFAHHGQRVVSGQRLMQASSDIFLGWLTVDPDPEGERRAYYVRQLKDWKGSATIEQMSATGMAAYGKLCGATLARAHARSGDRVAIAGYLGSGDVFDRAILDFSGAYAEQNERDYAALVQASSSGRITVRTGV